VDAASALLKNGLPNATAAPPAPASKTNSRLDTLWFTSSSQNKILEQQQSCPAKFFHQFRLDLAKKFNVSPHT
jgi:hypothetical protein